MREPAAPQDWIRAIESSLSPPILSRLVVLRSCASTQDEAVELSRGRPGLVVVGLRQSAGRGRLGREWIQSGDLGVAVSIALDAGRFDAAQISLASGLAAWRACRDVLDPLAPFAGRLGVRWPNDVVVRGSAAGPERKVAGVLVERRDPLLIVGLGINVLQTESDFPGRLGERAVSLGQVSGDRDPPTRLSVLRALLRAMRWAFSLSLDDLVTEWMRQDVLVGSQRAFRCGTSIVAGTVIRLDPLREIVMASDSGESVALDCRLAVRIAE